MRITSSLILLTNSFLYASDDASELQQNNRNGQLIVWQEPLAFKLHSEFTKIKDIIERESFIIQKRDLKLMDYTNILGEAWISAQSNEKIITPFLYQISKNGKIGYVLGSCHYVPLSFFSEEFLNVITSCRNFIGECGGNKPLSRVDLENSGLLINIGRREEDWFEDLDEVIKNYLTYIFKHSSKNLSKEVNIGEMTLKLAILIYKMSPQQLYSMDQEIEELFPKSNVYSLEKFEQVIDYMLPKFSSSVLEEWQEELYSNLRSGQGFIDESSKNFILNYKQGLLVVEPDTFLDNGSIIPRNLNWMKAWHSYFDKLDKPLFCIGAAHLFGEHGILNLLLQTGYSIEYPFGLALPICEIERYIE
ncbi:TraB/GumN family protein [Candidatus Paracaedibacter symbiosus]|uniref:TraB/GumN family protein n=1 Tax=Candidatus Paracaedibacter symbiosus TaxID=244582 RepID=UPI0018DC1B5A|nr:TraB/GumN family protein [Candidatus Paracaedibacter symbiosus]